jgi:hypothetical protein
MYNTTKIKLNDVQDILKVNYFTKLIKYQINNKL